MLSLIEGRAIGKINGGPLDNEIIGIKEIKNENKNKSNKSIEEYDEDIAIESDEESNEDSDNEIPKKKIIQDIDDTEFYLKKGKFDPFPTMKTREVIYVAGPSGSGKSTYAAKYIENYKKLNPDKDIFVFSRLDNDPAIDKLYPSYVKLDKSLIDNPIDITKELKDGCLVLFDDCDTITDEKVKKAVSKLKNDILETGRHMNIYIVNTSHLINPNDKKDGRTIMNECTSLTIFPKSGSSYAIKYALEKYFGLHKKIIEKILKLPSRWVTIFKNYPITIMYENGIFIPK